MIQTHAITKRFDRLQILKGIDIEMHDREIVAIVGPSGAGKTTRTHRFQPRPTP